MMFHYSISYQNGGEKVSMLFHYSMLSDGRTHVSMMFHYSISYRTCRVKVSKSFSFRLT